ncbi:DMT family transporter [Hydrogenophaga sp.]|uniref:DMT family transporter n=1 Tax=Hydrogenophaga sp. TaxID=1904254 RepID=UPI002C2260CC|nr:DMT family transporter [Hydrogenophaga sp.]HMP09559.1 DMT family transporter [Hydrogenophaga sp.]
MKTRHFIQLIGLSALWGASFMFLRIASPVLGPWVLAGGRVALAALTLALLMRVLRHHWPWSHWKELLLLAALSVSLPFLLYAWAALRLPAGYSALLNTTVVLFGTLSAAWLGQDTLTWRKLAGCAAGAAGVASIVRLGPVQPDWPTLMAALACIGAAFCYGISTPLMKRATQRIQPLAISATIHVLALLLVLPGALWALPEARFTAPALTALLVLGVITSGLAYWAHLRIIRHVSPVAATSPAFLIPVFGVTWGHLFLGEALSPGIFAGGALVLLATALVTGFNPLRRQAPPVEPAP